MPDEIRCVVPAGDICGEGAVWHPEQNALYWTDIDGFLVHRLDAKNQAAHKWTFDEPVTAVNLTTDPEELSLKWRLAGRRNTRPESSMKYDLPVRSGRKDRAEPSNC